MRLDVACGLRSMTFWRTARWVFSRAANPGLPCLRSLSRSAICAFSLRRSALPAGRSARRTLFPCPTTRRCCFRTCCSSIWMMPIPPLCWRWISSGWSFSIKTLCCPLRSSLTRKPCGCCSPAMRAIRSLPCPPSSWHASSTTWESPTIPMAMTICAGTTSRPRRWPTPARRSFPPVSADSPARCWLQTSASREYR